MKKVVLILLLLLYSINLCTAAEITVSGTTGTDIQKALDSASNGDTIIIPSGDYYITSRVYQKDKSLTLKGEGTVTIHLNTGSGSHNGLYFEGSEITEGKLPTSSKKGDTQITLSDASQVKKNDLIKIWKQVYWCPLDYGKDDETGPQLTGELYKIESVSGNTVTLNEPLLRDYGLSDSPRYEIRRPIEIHVSNIRFQDSGKTTPNEALSIRYCIDSSVKDCWFKDSGMSAISFYSSFNVEASNNEIYDCLKPGSGYGVGIWSGTAYALVENNHIENCRHAVTGNTDERSTLVRGVIIKNNYMVGATIAGANVVDAHNVALDYVVTNNEIHPGNGFYAFGDGTLTSLFANNKIYGGYGAVANRGSTDNGVHIVRDNYIEGDSVFTYRGTWYAKGTTLLIENNIQKGGRSGVYFGDADKEQVAYDNIVIRKNEFSDISGYGVYVLCNQDDENIEITDNVFSDIGKSDIEISGNGHSGGKVRIVENTFDRLDLDSHVSLDNVLDDSAKGKTDIVVDLDNIVIPEPAKKDNIQKDPENYIYVTDCDGKRDQEQINDALLEASKTGGTVYLDGLYVVDGTIWIYPGTSMIGSPETIVRVDSESSWWFREGIPVVGCPAKDIDNKTIVPHDIEICGFSIDGNCGAFDSKWANDGAGKEHNCEKLIILAGSSNNLGGNIEIHDMKLYNSFSDGIYIRYADGVSCYDNIISNCQHEGIYLSCVKNGVLQDNKIAGITSDCARLDNCKNCLIENNLFFSYGGDSYGAHKNGENGLQIGDAGISKGYDARKPDWKTQDIEVRFNTFSDPGLKAIWLHDGTENVYIHDNEFVDADELETQGISKDISYENPPSIEDSEEVFDSIFDVLDMEFSDGAYLEQGTLAPQKEWAHKGRYTDAWIDITGYSGQIRIGNKTYIPESPDKCAIVLFGTENLAKRPVSQKTSTKLTSNDGKLTVKLTVKTKYEVKAYKTYNVLGQSVKIPYYKEKSETVEFVKKYDTPDIFPVFEPPKVYVTHYNGSHAIVYTPEIDGIVRVDTSYNESECTERRLLGYIGTAQNGFKSTRYETIDSWSISGKQITQNPRGVRIEEPFDIGKLNVTVVTPYDSFEIEEFEYEVIEDDSLKILSYPLLSFIVIIGIYGRAILKVLYMVVGKFI